VQRLFSIPKKAPYSALTIIICFTYIVLTIGYSLGPIFEGPDEIEHYRFVRTIAQTGSLPNAYTQIRGEFHQAPLYYLLIAPLARLLPDSDFAQIADRLNPYYPSSMEALGNDNKNAYLHSANEVFPYASDTARAVHILRLFSLLCGIGTLLCCLGIFKTLWPTRPALQIVGLGAVALLPQFQYMSGVLNNDNLLILLSTAVLLVLLHQQKRGYSWREAFLLGALLGAAWITKVSGLALLVPVAIAFLLYWPGGRQVLLIAVVALAISGWWYARNISLYGDPVGFHAIFVTWPAESIREGRIALDIGIPRLPFIYQTVWARFGQGAIGTGPEIQWLFNGFIAISVLGIIRIAWKMLTVTHELVSPETLIVIAFAAAWLAATIYYASTVWSGNQGRYILPAMPAWGIMCALGLDVWCSGKCKLLSVPVLIESAFVCLFVYFYPAYQPTQMPATVESPIVLRFGDTAELIGVSSSLLKGVPDESVTLTLYWRAIAPTRLPLQTYLHSVEASTIRRDSFPALGNLLSTEWQPGQTWAERYLITIPPDAMRQHVYKLVAGLYDPRSRSALPAVDGQGKAVTPVVGAIAVPGTQEQLPAQGSDFRFGDLIGAMQPIIRREQATLSVCLDWRVLKSPGADYTLYVHALDRGGKMIVGQDFQPLQGNYPTSLWTQGEAIRECVRLDTPIADAVTIGIYDPRTQRRLSVVDTNGIQQLNNEIKVLIGDT